MKISISLKLTIWYSLVLFATLVLYAFLIYFFVSRQYYKQQNDLLRETAEEILQYVKQDGDILNVSHLENHVEDQNLNRYGIFFKIYDENSDVQFRSANFPVFDSELEKSCDRGERILIKDEYDITFQIFIIPIRHLSPHEEKSPYYLFVGQSTLYVTNVLVHIRELLIIFGIAMLVIAGMGGWYLARRALKPVSDITNTARALTAYHLDKRLPEKGKEDELGLLIHTFNEMIDRIQSGVLRIQQFSSDASHELRTPLTIMRGEIEVALRKIRSEEEYKSVLKSSLEEVQRMEKIVEDLLFFTRADSGHVQLENMSCNLVEMIKENIQKMQPLAWEKSIDMTFQPGQSNVNYEIDPGKFSQLIVNLLDNSIKYTGHGGWVNIGIHKTNGQIRIEIEDNGLGIPEGEISKVFDRFYRVDKSRSSASKSNGLGLSICKWIVEAYRGNIQIRSKEGEGTTVTIALPE